MEAVDYGRDAAKPETNLWSEALRLLVSDACSHWQGERVRDFNAHAVVLEQAFDDLVSCGPMLQHCCGFLDLEPDWLSEGFIRWCEQNG